MGPALHHELCFGCGRTNLFGLLLEVEHTAPGAVRGRCFIKQDHQGAARGFAHDGIVATALAEAMALACGPDARAQRIDIEYLAGPPAVGTFLELEARVEGGSAMAQAESDGEPVARATGTYVNR